jgi:hypothetical protein
MALAFTGETTELLSRVQVQAGLAPPAPTDAYGDPLPEGAVARMGSTRLNSSYGWLLAYGGAVDSVRLPANALAFFSS